MTRRHITPEQGAERQAGRRSPFERYERRRQEGWEHMDLGGHETVARLHMDLRRGAEAAREGRHALDRVGGAMSEDQLGALRLLVTELLTNAVRHAGGDWIALDVEIYANAVRVAVTDSGPGFQPKEKPTPHPDRPGGWGLCLVDSMADRWGVARNGRTSVWFELDQPRFANAA